MTFNKNYFLAATLLFAIEVLIALFVHDNFIRPYIGDVLVVILIYCVVKTCIKIGWFPAVTGVLLFAFSAEVLQYVNIVYWLGWEESVMARTVIGTSFSWIDMLCYMAGCGLICCTESNVSTKSLNT